MKIAISLIAALFLGIYSSFYAQMRATPEERVERLKERINLSENQSLKILSIYKEMTKKMEDEISPQTPREERRSKIAKFMEKADAEILKILDKNQTVEYKNIIKEREKRSKDRQENKKNNRD